MSVSGLCQICESRPADRRCTNCGTFACEAHFERDVGLCVDCAQSRTFGEGDSTDQRAPKRSERDHYRLP